MGVSEGFDSEGFGGRVRFARNRKRFRDGRKWTQTDLAKNVGVSLNTVSEWERGRQPRDPAILSKLAQVLEVSVGWLLDGSLTAVSEQRQPYEPRAAATRRLPPRARERVFDYLQRLEGLISEPEIDEVERTMVESTFNKLHVYEPRDRSEEDLIKDIDAAWEFVRYVLRKRGIVV